jgi:hypothetical protein
LISPDPVFNTLILRAFDLAILSINKELSNKTDSSIVYQDKQCMDKGTSMKRRSPILFNVFIKGLQSICQGVP